MPTRVSLGVSDSFNSRELHTVVCSPYEEFQSLLFVKFSDETPGNHVISVYFP